MNLLAIDPSISNLGWAIFSEDVLVAAGAVKQRTATSVDYKIRSMWMSQEIKKLSISYNAHDVVTETQSNWFNQKSTGAKDNESIQKLYYFTGCLCGILAHPVGLAQIYGVEPGGWKGQTPKGVVIRRISKKLEKQGITLTDTVAHDTYEAIAIGFFAIKKRTDTGSFEAPLVPILSNQPGGRFELITNL